MPCPHNEITIVQRSQQQSAVAAAAGELTPACCHLHLYCTVNKTATSVCRKYTYVNKCA